MQVLADTVNRGDPAFGGILAREDLDENQENFFGVWGRKLVRAEIRELAQVSNEALAAILDSLSAHVVTLDRQGRVDYASRSWLDFAHENGGDWVGIGRTSHRGLPLACASVTENTSML